MTSTSIHRLLDEAFAGVAPSPATQDLKEELRTNLMARVDELEASGMNGGDAARRAFDELGDVRSLIADAAADTTPDWERNRVRYSGAFVVRATIMSIIAAAVLICGVLAAAAVLPGGVALAAALFAGFALLIGIVTGDSLAQETTSDYAMPRPRAAGYGIGTGLLLAGAGGIALCWSGPLWAWLVGGGVLLLAGIGLLAGLDATQTNRTKSWTREFAAQWGQEFTAQHAGAWSAPSGDRFSRDPNAAARFGIYTVVIWIVAIVAGVLVGIFCGWWWSLLAIVGAVIAMLLLLTRMLFVPERHAVERKAAER